MHLSKLYLSLIQNLKAFHVTRIHNQTLNTIIYCIIIIQLYVYILFSIRNDLNAKAFTTEHFKSLLVAYWYTIPKTHLDLGI